MATIKKSRFIIRRGTDSSRYSTVLCEGEPGYTTDTKRIFIGDGVTPGGNHVGTYFHNLAKFSSSLQDVTYLSAASAGGVALSGDYAFKPLPASVTNMNGDSISPPNSACGLFFVLTGGDASKSESWVSVNSGIPSWHIHYGSATIPTSALYGDNKMIRNKTHVSAFSASFTTTSGINIPSLSNKLLSATATGDVSGVEIGANKYLFTKRYTSTMAVSDMSFTTIHEFTHGLGSIPDWIEVNARYTGSNVSVAWGGGTNQTMVSGMQFDVKRLGAWRTSGTEDQTPSWFVNYDETKIYVGYFGTTWQWLANSADLYTYDGNLDLVVKGFKLES